MKTKIALFILAFLAGILPANAQRKMENLGRGVVAVRTENSSAFISWRLLGTESWDIGFNIYRIAGNGTPEKLNTNVLVKGTNFTDNSINASVNNSYFVKPMVNEIEQEASVAYTLKANTAIEPCIVVPLKNGPEIHFVWVGDLDGDGAYDYIVDRLEWGVGCKVEAYKSDGTFLWTVDMGPNSTNMDNISPGSSTIDVGHWDGVTVYDMDEDGKAEVMFRTANGVIFGDGSVLQHSNNNVQFVSVVDGMTGAERARAEIPNNYISVGPMACSMGIGYLNGVTPSLITFMKNRNSDKSFNRIMCAWDFDGTDIRLKWKTNMSFGASYGTGSDGHQMRIIDVDGDGKDDVGHVGFVLKGEDGTPLYDMGGQGIGHGDRWFVGKLDPNRPGLQGYGIQQYNSILDYYYDAATGELIWKHSTSDGSVGDVGRGSVGDVDPNYSGFEVWQFSGLYNGPSNTFVSPTYAYPNLRIWWDGDLLSENLNDGKLEKYLGGSVSRLLTTWHYNSATESARNVPMFYGDIMGDWREEAIYTSSDYSKLVIFTTPIESNHRIYTLPHNPAYRNGMTIKGYLQSHMLDFYLGHGMTTPPTPPIQTAKCTWQGDGASNIWDVASSANWHVNNTNGTFLQNDDVLFDISGHPDTTVVLKGDLNPSSIKIITPINYAFNGDGTLQGNSSLIKAGSGTLSLNCHSAYGGKTSLEEGSLYVNDSLVNSKTTVYPLATLGGKGVVANELTLMPRSILSPGDRGETGILTLKGDLNLPENVTLNFDITDDSTGVDKPSDKISIGGDLSFDGDLLIAIRNVDAIIKPGEYPLMTYSGTFTGDLNKVEITGLFGKKYSLIDADSTITLKIEGSRSAASINWNGTSDVWDLLTTLAWNMENEAVTFVANDTVTFDGNNASNQSITVEGQMPIADMIVTDLGTDYAFTGNGSISGEGSVVKTGTGTLSLLSNNSYKGQTIINGGTLEVNRFSEVGESSSIGANESPAPSEFVLDDATLLYSGSGSSFTNRGLTIAGNSDTIKIQQSGAVFIMEGVIAGTADLVKSGPGKLTLKNANTFTGNTFIKQGDLFLGNETANSSGLNRGSVTFENGTLSMGGGSYTEFRTNLIVPENTTGTFNTDDRCNYRGTLTGSGTLNMYLPGTIDRAVFFGNWSAFSGTINITGVSGSRFRIANSYGYVGSIINLGPNIGMYHGGSGSTGGDSRATTVEIGGLTGSTLSSIFDENWIIGGNNEDCAYLGTIKGHSLQKVGTGALFLRGNNTYTGGTTVSNGTLMVINPIGSATGTGTVKVNNGGILSGNGTVSGATTINSGGEIMPGNDGIGRLKINSNLTLRQGSSAIIEIENMLYDRILVSGNLSFQGSLTINKVDTAAFKNGDFFKIFTASTYSGELSEIVPDTPGEGLIWDTSELYTNGMLKVTNFTGIIANTVGSSVLKSYPNPVDNHLYLESVNGEIIQQVTIQSIKGISLINVNLNAKEGHIDVAGLTKGVYLLKVCLGNDIIVQKITKQ